MCPGCGCNTTRRTEQIFSDKTSHIREICAACGKFLKFAAQDVKSFRDRLFDLVGKLADSTTINQVNECQRVARDMMREAREKNQTTEETTI